MDVDRCSEWRALASCRLDGELDELQTARLERHLLGCQPCRSWTGEIAALTTVLRDSMAECPVGSSELRPRALRRRLVRSASAASAASAAAVAAFAIALPGAAIDLLVRRDARRVVRSLHVVHQEAGARHARAPVPGDGRRSGARGASRNGLARP